MLMAILFRFDGHSHLHGHCLHDHGIAHAVMILMFDCWEE